MAIASDLPARPPGSGSLPAAENRGGSPAPPMLDPVPTGPLAWWGMPSVFDGLDVGSVLEPKGEGDSSFEDPSPSSAATHGEPWSEAATSLTSFATLGDLSSDAAATRSSSTGYGDRWSEDGVTTPAHTYGTHLFSEHGVVASFRPGKEPGRSDKADPRVGHSSGSRATVAAASAGVKDAPAFDVRAVEWSAAEDEPPYKDAPRALDVRAAGFPASDHDPAHAEAIPAAPPASDVRAAGFPASDDDPAHADAIAAALPGRSDVHAAEFAASDDDPAYVESIPAGEDDDPAYVESIPAGEKEARPASHVRAAELPASGEVTAAALPERKDGPPASDVRVAGFPASDDDRSSRNLGTAASPQRGTHMADHGVPIPPLPGSPTPPATSTYASIYAGPELFERLEAPSDPQLARVVPDTDGLDIRGEFRRTRDNSARGSSADVRREADGVPHDVVGLTALFSVMFAALAVVVFASGGTFVRAVAVLLTVLGLPLFVSWLATRSERERDHTHPSR